MKIFTTIGGSILALLIMLGIGFFLAIGLCLLAAKDLFCLLSRRFTSRLRGDRVRRYMPPEINWPALSMDADGFVEPPLSPATGYGRSAINGGFSACALPAPRKLGSLAVALLPDPGPKVLAFPVDPAVRARIRARSKRQPYVVAAAGPKVVSLDIYRPRRKK